MKGENRSWNVWVDTGGTFTDCIGIDPDGNVHRAKVLSSSALRGEIVAQTGDKSYKLKQEWGAPFDFVKGFVFRSLKSKQEAIVLSYDAQNSMILLDREIDLFDILPQPFEVITDEEAPVLAARLLTKTPSDEKLPPLNLRLATTLATNALLEKKGIPPLLLITKGFEDFLEIGNQQRPDLFSLKIIKPQQLYVGVVGVDERMDADGISLLSFDEKPISKKLSGFLNDGVASAAVVFMNSPKNSIHEELAKELLLNLGFDHVSVSTELSKSINILSRAQTTVVNAYLAPIIQNYLNSIQSSVPGGNIHVMTSAGGLSQLSTFQPKDSLLSGPAGGVVGAVTAAKTEGFDKVISFDMGGTSTDVARYSGQYDYLFEHKVGDAHLAAPAVNVETVAAGGGSVCFFDGQKLCVGPESAGANPGPACYGAGGPLTITDVNLLLGRLDNANFHIPIFPEDSEYKLNEIISEIEEQSGQEQQHETILDGFLKIANEKMAEAIRRISIRKGYDCREYVLTAFGGAGAQHSCSIAKLLGIRQILVPACAGLLSAYGLGNAEIGEFSERQVLKPLHEIEDRIIEWIDELSEQAKQKIKEHFNSDPVNLAITRKILSIRFEGQENTLAVEFSDGINIAESFKNEYISQFGHWVENRALELESIRVVASVSSGQNREMLWVDEKHKVSSPKIKDVWFHQHYQKTPLYHRSELNADREIEGPAIILDPHSTIVIEPGWKADISENGAIILKHERSFESEAEQDHSEAILLELFTNRFTAIAEQMGEMLQRTALSVNVKDRLDFSCALLNAEGELVVNAPHIPVHLGALGVCVRSLMENIEMDRGDVIVTNHPAFGGSHLPDITVVTPIFSDDEILIGFAANRAHHAEIGGTAPGSMPPNAASLAEEGVVIPPMHLVKNGNEKWDEIKNLLARAAYPSRNIEENMADLRAAVAANQFGLKAMKNLVSNHGFLTVTEYMAKLKINAAAKIKHTIKNLPKGRFESVEYLDDGTPLKAAITINESSVTFDFTGTGPVQKGNLNATPAIVNSVIMYVLRLLVNEPVPLNDGLLDPVKIILPPCLLSPHFDKNSEKCPAVVGGNTEVSQRLTDTLLKPFGIIACSQGTMNNVLFGNQSFGYYETVGGGTGAGSGFNGASAVHHHMTNTRGTDPELLEHKYPARLDKYAIRRNSGGKGKWNGGDGIIREMTFIEPVQLSVLTQHRVEKPYGLNGGKPGKQGEQWIYHKNGIKDKLQSIDGKDLKKGDRFILKTPGGGGYGKPLE